jgi:hypothetical protein
VLPSGLGSEVDPKIANVTDSEGLLVMAPECQGLATKMATVSPDQIQLQFERALAKPSTFGDFGDEMYEADTSLDGLISADRGEGRAWILPSGLMSKLIGSNPAEVAVIAIDRSHAGWIVGDRVFVDTTKRDVSSGGYFAFNSDDGFHIEHCPHGAPIADPPTTGTLLGKVVAAFVWQDGRFFEPRRFGKLLY